jgi:hypothetical protein
LTLIRKALWPSAIAIGFLVFLGAIGSGTAGRVSAAPGDDGDICLIEGPTLITEGDTVGYAARIQDNEDGEQEFEASVDNISGSAFIVSIVDAEYPDASDSDHEEIGPTTNVQFLENWVIGASDEELLEDLLDDYGWEAEEEVCGDTEDEMVEDILADLVDLLREWITEGIDQGSETAATGDDDIDCDTTLVPGCSISSAIQIAVAEALADYILGLIEDGVTSFDATSCNDLHDIAEDTAIEEGAAETIGSQFGDYFETVCNDGENDFFLLLDFVIPTDDVVFVDVTCEEAGVFEVAFSQQAGGEGADEPDDTLSLEVTCVGEVDEGVITATPNKVEIVPAIGSVSYSLIVVSLLDENGDPVVAGDVDFVTDRCEFLDEDGLTMDEFKAVADLFADYDLNDHSTADAIEDATLDSDDPDDVSNHVPSFMLDDDAGDFDEGDTLAAIILDCSAANTVPGVANVSFQVDQGGSDVVGSVKVTVVGPPASITVSASPTSLRCGEKATITATVKDSVGQAVSPHTRVEAITNAGGVLAGTGAVAGQAGPVVPISSTVAETDSSGNTTIFLLTSEQHSGAYEVVVTSGGSGAVTSVLGGLFSTQPVSAQTTVSCSLAAAVAPTVTAPRTGQGGITPPSTGDAGLVGSSSTNTSWALVLGGVVALALVSVATVKVARR